MDWTNYWYIFCASLPTGSRIACVCLFLHLTLSLIAQWQPLLGESSDQYLHVLHSTHTPLGVSTQDDQDTDTCPSVFSCTEPIRHYERDQLLSCKPWTGLFDPLLISRLQELGIGHHLSLRRSCRGGRRKQRKIRVVCDGAARPRSAAPVRPTEQTTLPQRRASVSEQNADLQASPHFHAENHSTHECNPLNLILIDTSPCIQDKSQCFKVMSFNSQSCRNKTDDVCDLITQGSYDLVFLTEM